MPIEINSFLGDICNSMYSASGLNKLFSSVLYLSIILTLVIILLIMLLYPCKKDTSTWILVRLFLYILLTVTTVFSIHNSFIKNKYKERYANKNVDVFMNNIHGGNAYHDEKIEVKPQMKPCQYEEVQPDKSVSELLEELERKPE